MPLSNSGTASTNFNLWRTAWVCVALKLLQALSTAVSMVPRLRLLESNLCRTYYQINNAVELEFHGDVPQGLCKINPIQAELAQLTGWNSFFSHATVLLLGVPYGIFSERFNRKSVLIWNISFSVLSQVWILATCYFHDTINIQFIWLANLIDCIGGGKLVFSTVTQVMIAEIVPIQHLSNVYFRLTSAMSVCRFVGVASGSFLLGYSIWTPMWLAVIIYSTCLPVIILLHHDYPIQLHAIRPTQQRLQNEDIQADQHGDDNRPKTRFTLLPRSLTGYLAFVKTHFRILAAFLIHETGMGVRNITEQWISKRYNWPLRTTGYILAFETFLGSMYLAVLPTISRCIPGGNNRHYGAEQRNRQFIIVRASLFAAAAGTALIAASGRDRSVFLVALGVFVFGVGFHDALKAYVTGLINTKAIVRMYMCISIAETVANVFSGPTWAAIHGLGLTDEGSAMSFPFIVSSLLFLGTLEFVEQMKTNV